MTAPSPPPVAAERIRLEAKEAIRTFCNSLGAGSVAMSHGVERIYHAGISLDALAGCVALRLAALSGALEPSSVAGPGIITAAAVTTTTAQPPAAEPDIPPDAEHPVNYRKAFAHKPAAEQVTAEPVAWRYEHFSFSDNEWVPAFNTWKPTEGDRVRNVVALYAYPAPAEAVNALETIRDAFWSDGETAIERVDDLKEIARAALQTIRGGK